MRKTIISFCISLIVGILCGSMVLSQYKNNIKHEEKQKYPVYMVQQGVYSSLESMEENTVDLSDYMYIKQDDKYYVYVGVFLDRAIADRVKDNYNKDLYVKENDIDDETLVLMIKQNDENIKENSSKSDILSASKKSLEIYEGKMNEQIGQQF